MIRNNADLICSIISCYADEGDDVTLRWHAGSPESPLGSEIPASLEVLNPEGLRLASLYAFENGFTTVLAALGTNPKEFKETWPNAGPKMRVRRGAEGTFEIRNVSW